MELQKKSSTVQQIYNKKFRIFELNEILEYKKSMGKNQLNELFSLFNKDQTRVSQIRHDDIEDFYMICFSSIHLFEKLKVQNCKKKNK